MTENDFTTPRFEAIKAELDTIGCDVLGCSRICHMSVGDLGEFGDAMHLVANTLSRIGERLDAIAESLPG